MSEEVRPFKILSLDGGGIRGAFGAGFLAGVEERLGIRIGEHFDMLAGTSTGAIIAAALATGEPAKRIEEFYRERGPRIFKRRSRSWWGWALCPLTMPTNCLMRRIFGVEFDQLFRAKYAAVELKAAFQEVFGDSTLESSRTRLVIPSIDLTQGQTVVFKTPHVPNMFRDRHYKFADVLLATTAAPTYFPHASIAKSSAYVDGGLWANNPSMVAIVEALRINSAAKRNTDYPIHLQQTYMLSIGTGRAPFFETPKEDGAGALFWIQRVLNISAVAQSQGINFQTQYLLGDRAHRVDYELPNGRWTLDNAEVVDQMIHMGRSKADQMIAKLEPLFFVDKAKHPYVPFPDKAGQSEAV